ncbi:MAG: Nucleoid-associated protein [Alphaproteobacteria bacterium MarineAlpha9_Bin4]|nr:MAG: Nucleoid-associated protein [Alphaproteobacteria bacterium MarineAlpha9_Bin4]|tara:strand:- start:2327 stop:2638 length:312 start_codon:yes stop_codon:yes gene_type:complete
MQNMGALLQQAQMMQKKMQEVESKLKTLEVEGEVSEGMVKVTMNGKGEILKIKIDPSLKEDIEVIEDLLMAAISEAKKKADNLSEAEMKNITGGMPLPPGMKF